MLLKQHVYFRLTFLLHLTHIFFIQGSITGCLLFKFLVIFCLSLRLRLLRPKKKWNSQVSMVMLTISSIDIYRILLLVFGSMKYIMRSASIFVILPFNDVYNTWTGKGSDKIWIEELLCPRKRVKLSYCLPIFGHVI